MNNLITLNRMQKIKFLFHYYFKLQHKKKKYPYNNLIKDVVTLFIFFLNLLAHFSFSARVCVALLWNPVESITFEKELARGFFHLLYVLSSCLTIDLDNDQNVLLTICLLHFIFFFYSSIFGYNSILSTLFFFFFKCKSEKRFDIFALKNMCNISSPL